MISLKEALAIHQMALDRFGGASGIRDIGLLESALQRPWSTFEGKELYPTTEGKGAALIESLVKNHPFFDGNKRTGYILMRLLLLKSGLDILASEDDKYEFVIAIASGRFDYEQIKLWLEARIIK